jgi:hypothetical protein
MYLLCNQFHAIIVEERLSQQNILYISTTILQHTTSTASVFTSLDVKADPSRTALSMDQQSIVMYLSLRGLNAVPRSTPFNALDKSHSKKIFDQMRYFGKTCN